MSSQSDEKKQFAKSWEHLQNPEAASVETSPLDFNASPHLATHPSSEIASFSPFQFSLAFEYPTIQHETDYVPLFTSPPPIMAAVMPRPNSSLQAEIGICCDTEDTIGGMQNTLFPSIINAPLSLSPGDLNASNSGLPYMGVFRPGYPRNFSIVPSMISLNDTKIAESSGMQRNSADHICRSANRSLDATPTDFSPTKVSTFLQECQTSPSNSQLGSSQNSETPLSAHRIQSVKTASNVRKRIARSPRKQNRAKASALKQELVQETQSLKNGRRKRTPRVSRPAVPGAAKPLMERGKHEVSEDSESTAVKPLVVNADSMSMSLSNVLIPETTDIKAAKKELHVTTSESCKLTEPQKVTEPRSKLENEIREGSGTATTSSNELIQGDSKVWDPFINHATGRLRPGRKSKGCWTCKLRRKRCDGRRPSCQACEKLNIQCDGYSSARPSYMINPQENIKRRNMIRREPIFKHNGLIRGGNNQVVTTDQQDDNEPERVHKHPTNPATGRLRPGPKSNGCWTCKLRRKLCDGRRPCCETCEKLNIKCDGFANARPSFMTDPVEREKRRLEIKRMPDFKATHRATSCHSSH